MPEEDSSRERFLDAGKQETGVDGTHLQTFLKDSVGELVACTIVIKDSEKGVVMLIKGDNLGSVELLVIFVIFEDRNI